jgi:tetratricopeptide (TPR) repeat protein
MKRIVWTGLSVSLLVASSTAYAEDAPAAAPAAGGQCISDAAKESLTKCEGSGTFAPKGDKPQGVKLGAVTPESKTAKDAKIAPSLSQDDMKTQRQRVVANKVRELLIKEIAQLEGLWKVTGKGAGDRVQLARRLAETYVELENASFREKIEAEIKGDTAAADKAKKTVDLGRGNAIKYYKLVANEYKSYPQLDEVLYYLAFEYEQGNNLEEARKVYFQLINDAPQSKYIPNAYLAFGELFFTEAQGDPSKFQLARDAYQKVLEYPPAENKVYGYAQYKLAYASWNLGEHAKALDGFKKVIDYGNQYGSNPGVPALQKAARKDIVPVYTLVGRPDGAYAFFKPISGDGPSENKGTYEMMDNLGLNYIDTGHYAEAVQIYEDLIKRDKGDNLCKYQAHIVEATMAMKGGASKTGVRAKLEEQSNMYKRFKTESHSEESKKECANVTAGLLTETAMAWHLEAVGSGGTRGTGDKNTMKLAAEVYNFVVTNFTKDQFAAFEFPRIQKEDWPNLFKIKYAMADLLYFQQDWEKCGPAFDLVVEEDPNGPEAPEAAYAAVLCYQKLYDQTHQGDKGRQGGGNLPGQSGKPGKGAKPAAPESMEKKEMATAKKGMVKAFDRYVCYVKPGDDQKAKDQYVEVKYARARTYFEEHYWEESAEGFKDIALNHSDHDSGIYAAQLYLESLNVLGTTANRSSCYDEMGESVPKLITLYCDGGKAAKNADQCIVLQKIQSDIERVRADARIKEAAGGGANALRKYEEAGNMYLALAKKCAIEPIDAGQDATCAKPEEILWNAAEAYQSARLVVKSIQTRQYLLNPKYKFNETDFARRSMYKIGGNYQAIAVYDQAADWYERYAKTYPAGDKADQALSDAVVLRLGLGQEKEAIEDTDFFLKTYGSKKPAQTAQVAFAIGAHYVEREDWDMARKRLSGAMKLIDANATLDVQVQAHALLGRTYIRIKVDKNAQTEYRKVQSLWSNPDEATKKIMADADGGPRRLGKALTAVGEAFFYFAEKEKKKVDAIRFPEYKGPNDKDSVLKHISGKVKDWLLKKKAAIEAAEKEYLKVVELKPDPPPRWVIASGARVGGMWGEFVREFRAAPIPADMKRDDELRNTYYNALDSASEPQKQRAKAAFETCLKYSVTYQYFDEYSRSCEVWLSKTYKSEYHQVDEFRGAPNRVNSGLSDRPYPLELDGTPFNPNPPPPPAADEKSEAVTQTEDKTPAKGKGGKKPGKKK